MNNTVKRKTLRFFVAIALVASLFGVFAPQAQASLGLTRYPQPVLDCMDYKVSQPGYNYTTSPLGCMWKDINYSGAWWVMMRLQTNEYRGWAYYLTMDGWKANDAVSSLFNNTGYFQYYYRDINLKGGYLPVSPGAFLADLRSCTETWGNWNDQISSIQVYNTPW